MLNKYVFLLILIVMILLNNNLSYAETGSIAEPEWYEADIALIKPVNIKTGSAGVLRFSIKPLIEGDFEFKAALNVNSKNIKLKQSDSKKLKTSNMRKIFYDFEFTTTEPVYGNFSAEFSTAYPAADLIKTIEKKFGSDLYEVKKLTRKINFHSNNYSASIPFKLIVTETECALNPELYFEKSAGEDFLNMKPSISTQDALNKIESFEAKYAGIFDLNKDGFYKFIKRTNCDFLKDLNDYFKGLHAYNYSAAGIGENNKTAAVKELKSVSADYAKIFEFIEARFKYFNETKKASSEYIKDNGPEHIYIATYYNLYFTVNFKNCFNKKDGEKDIIKNYEAVLNLISESGLYKTEVLKKSIAGYFYYNLAQMSKKSGAIDYKRYFRKAVSENKGLITE